MARYRPQRLAVLARRRIIRRPNMVEPGESCRDYMVTNDRHLLGLDPYEGVRIVSMTQYYQILVNEDFIRPDH